MVTGQMVVVGVVVVAMCVVVTCAVRQNNNNYVPFINYGPRLEMMPRCHSAAKPCRTKAVMQAHFLPAESREIRSPPCSCQSADCSDDWEAHQDRVITRQLVTNGNISMTFSMMFCTAIQPRIRCRSRQVALQLSGWTPMPTEVDFINCVCPERKPLVLHTVTTGADHKQYHAYVCFRHKRKCKIRRQESCMVMDPQTYTVSYPCRCSNTTSCREHPEEPHRYICQP